MMVFLFALVLLICFSGPVIASSISPDENGKEVVGRSGSSVDFVWTVTLTGADTSIITATLYIVNNLGLPRKISHAIAPSTENVEDPYKFRLKLKDAIVVKNNKATITYVLSELKFDDTSKYQLSVSFNTAKSVDGVINLTVRVKPRDPGTKSDNAGVIAGAVVGAIVFIAIVVVAIVFYLRWKKNKSSPSVSNKESVSLNAGYGTNNEPQYGQYAAPDISSSEQKPQKSIYAELGPGGGRDGPKPAVEKSEYTAVKLDKDGYPATGAPRGPAKPIRGIVRDDEFDDSTDAAV